MNLEVKESIGYKFFCDCCEELGLRKPETSKGGHWVIDFHLYEEYRGFWREEIVPKYNEQDKVLSAMESAVEAVVQEFQNKSCDEFLESQSVGGFEEYQKTVVLEFS